MWKAHESTNMCNIGLKLPWHQAGADPDTDPCLQESAYHHLIIYAYPCHWQNPECGWVWQEVARPAIIPSICVYIKLYKYIRLYDIIWNIWLSCIHVDRYNASSLGYQRWRAWKWSWLSAKISPWTAASNVLIYSTLTLLIVGLWFLQNVELVGALWAFNFQRGFQTMFLGRLGHRGFIPRRVPWVSSQLESKKHSDDDEEEEEGAFWAIRVALNDLRPGCTIPMTVTMTTRNSVQNILPLVNDRH